MNRFRIPGPPTLALIWAILNILLYSGMMSIENQHRLHLIFILTRVCFLTSVIMQMLVAIGIVELKNLR